METYTISNRKIQLIKSDITEMDTDAIVNAANAQLQLGGGVAGAIQKKGGDKIQQECNEIGGTPVGSAVITTGGNLKTKFVIHTVGPMMGEGDEDNKLKNATLHSLKIANQNNLKSIAFPAISTGIFGYPLERCAKIMLSNVTSYLSGNTSLEKVIFCLFDQNAFDVFKNELILINE